MPVSVGGECAEEECVDVLVDVTSGMIFCQHLGNCGSCPLRVYQELVDDVSFCFEQIAVKITDVLFLMF